MGAARRIHDGNAAHMAIESANSVDDANNASDAEKAALMTKNTAPIAATPASQRVGAKRRPMAPRNDDLNALLAYFRSSSQIAFNLR